MRLFCIELIDRTKTILLKTTDENWKPTFLKENVTRIHKIALLNSFAVYCNSDETLLNKELKEKAIVIKSFSIGAYFLCLTYENFVLAVASKHDQEKRRNQIQ